MGAALPVTSWVLLSGAASCFLGFLATVAALVVRWPVIRVLGSAYFARFLAVQAVAINLVLFGVVAWAAGNFGWSAVLFGWAGPPLYGLVFFAYSLTNIDFTARKYHGFGVDAAPTSRP